MSDEIKHECAVALLRLLEAPEAAGGSGGAAPRSLPDPGGTLLSLLLEKQHNRGQDGAGAAILSLAPEPGRPAWWIRKSASATALADLLGAIGRRPASPGESLFLGHLRYATYGRGDESFCHPFVHAEPRLDRTLFLAGNFNLTNTNELFEAFHKAGNHPASSADGYLICELIAQELSQCSQIPIVHNCPQITNPNPGALGERALPKQTPRTPRTPRENEPPILRALCAVLPKLDGAFTLCGMTGDGWAFAVRDAHGIRPGWYLAPPASPRAVAVASERPAVQAAFDVPPEAVRELPPGVALLVSPAGEVRFERVLEPAGSRPCVFERIYFSRANDADIHRERKALGAALAAPLLRAVDFDLDRTFFSYIPNSAQVAFHGLLEALWTEGLAEGRPVRFGQVAVKDAKFRTFIADAAARREIGKHVYDVTYGLVRPGVDTLVVLDDSIVRGTTMREAILPMLDRLGPKRIVIASSAPPIRYPDCYGIDMSTLGELVAFRALVNLLGDEAEAELRAALAGAAPDPLAALYARFSDAEHAAEIARLLTPPGMRAEVIVVYQTVDALRAAVQTPSVAESNPSTLQPFNLSTFPDGGTAAIGDWYFTGDYPTPGGYRVLRRSLENHLARREGRSY